MKKILIISKYASSSSFGFESRISNIARNMIDLGNDVNIITSDSNHFASYENFKKIYNKIKCGDLKIICIKTFKYSKTASIRRVLSWIDFELKLFFINKNSLFEKPDVIIVSSLSLLTILNGIILKYKYNSKLVFEVRDIWPLTLIEEGNYSRYNPLVILLSIVEKIGYRFADLIIGTMPNLSDHVTNVLGHKNHITKCIPFGFSLKEYNSYKKTENNIFDKHKEFFNNRFIVAHVGSIGLTNGLDTFVKAIKEFNKLSSIGFVFLGDGANKVNYKFELKDCSNVLFFPKVEKSQVKFYIEKFDVLYFASLKSKVWDYGWSPNKIVDYMLAGKPIIASYSGHRSMLNEAKCGDFVESENLNQLKNKILEYSKLPANRLLKMGKNGRKWIIQNRQINKLAKDYLDLIYKM